MTRLTVFACLLAVGFAPIAAAHLVRPSHKLYQARFGDAPRYSALDHAAMDQLVRRVAR